MHDEVVHAFQQHVHGAEARAEVGGLGLARGAGAGGRANHGVVSGDLGVQRGGGGGRDAVGLAGGRGAGGVREQCGVQCGVQCAGAVEQGGFLHLAPVGEGEIPLRGLGEVVLRDKQQAQRAGHRMRGDFERSFGGVLLVGGAGDGRGLRVAKRGEVARTRLELAFEGGECRRCLVEPEGFVGRNLQIDFHGRIHVQLGEEFVFPTRCLFSEDEGTKEVLHRIASRIFCLPERAQRAQREEGVRARESREWTRMGGSGQPLINTNWR